MSFEAVIDSQNIKSFANGLAVLGKVGKSIKFEVSASKFTMRTLNDAKSAYMIVTLNPSFFYQYVAPPSGSGLTFGCIAKVCNQVFKSMKNVQNITMKIEEDGAGMFLCFYLQCRFGIVKKHRVTYEDCTVESVVIDPQELDNILSMKRHALEHIIQYMAVDSMNLHILNDRVRISSFVEGTKATSTLQLETKVELEQNTFDTFTCGQPNSDITISLDEVRAFLGYVKWMDEDDVQIRFQSFGDPVILLARDASEKKFLRLILASQQQSYADTTQSVASGSQVMMSSGPMSSYHQQQEQQFSGEYQSGAFSQQQGQSSQYQQQQQQHQHHQNQYQQQQQHHDHGGHNPSQSDYSRTNGDSQATPRHPQQHVSTYPQTQSQQQQQPHQHQQVQVQPENQYPQSQQSESSQQSDIRLSFQSPLPPYYSGGITNHPISPVRQKTPFEQEHAEAASQAIRSDAGGFLAPLEAATTGNFNDSAPLRMSELTGDQSQMTSSHIGRNPPSSVQNQQFEDENDYHTSMMQDDFNRHQQQQQTNLINQDPNFFENAKDGNFEREGGNMNMGSEEAETQDSWMPNASAILNPESQDKDEDWDKILNGQDEPMNFLNETVEDTFDVMDNSLEGIQSTVTYADHYTPPMPISNKGRQEGTYKVVSDTETPSNNQRQRQRKKRSDPIDTLAYMLNDSQEFQTELPPPPNFNARDSTSSMAVHHLSQEDNMMASNRYMGTPHPNHEQVHHRQNRRHPHHQVSQSTIRGSTSSF